MTTPAINGPFLQAPEKTMNRPYAIHSKTFNIKCNVEIDNDWEDTSKRRLNTHRILPKSKRNHNIIQSWQSSYKRWNRNQPILERIWCKRANKKLVDEIDEQIITDILRIVGTNNEI